MGYFSNGAQGHDYEAQYCSHCAHDAPAEERVCPVLQAHLMWNYDECNKPDSVLHKMIPRGEHGRNLKCVFFHEKGR